MSGCLGAIVRLAIFAGLLWYVTSAVMRIPPVRAFADALKSGDSTRVTAAADDVRAWFEGLIAGKEGATSAEAPPANTSSDGVEPNTPSGADGGVYEPGNGVTMPRVTRRVDPSYTAEATRRKIEGSVMLTCVVRPDFTVSDIEVVRSLDPVYGLDQEAIKALAQWRFTPGRREGRFVPVRITVEMTFTLP